MFGNVTIVGVGLISGSCGHGLMEYGLGKDII
jgi:prephenate dehydrogenase